MSKNYVPSFEQDDILYEHANFPASLTGLSRGYVYASTEAGGHGPRIKYYLESPDKSAPYAIFEISDNPRVFKDDLGLSNSQIREIKKFIIQNKDALLFFWYDGTKMMAGDTANFLKVGIHKLDETPKKKFDPKDFGVENPSFNKPKKL